MALSDAELFALMDRQERCMSRCYPIGGDHWREDRLEGADFPDRPFRYGLIRQPVTHKPMERYVWIRLWGHGWLFARSIEHGSWRSVSWCVQ